MTGVQVLVRMLELYGVRHVFGLPGDTSMALYDALRECHSISHVVCRDERAASYMALGYSRLSFRPGVCEVPSGGGAAYGLPGVTEANGSCVPLVFLNSDVPTSSDGREALTAMDVQGVFRPITQWNAKVYRPEMLPRMLRRAFRSATSGRMGAVQVGIPEDVLSDEVDERNLGDMYAEDQCRTYPAFRARPDAALVRRCAQLIADAKRPLVIAGGGIHLSQACAYSHLNLSQFSR